MLEALTSNYGLILPLDIKCKGTPIPLLENINVKHERARILLSCAGA